MNLREASTMRRAGTTTKDVTLFRGALCSLKKHVKPQLAPYNDGDILSECPALYNYCNLPRIASTV